MRTETNRLQDTAFGKSAAEARAYYDEYPDELPPTRTVEIAVEAAVTDAATMDHMFILYWFVEVRVDGRSPTEIGEHRGDSADPAEQVLHHAAETCQEQFDEMGDAVNAAESLDAEFKLVPGFESSVTVKPAELEPTGQIEVAKPDLER